MEAFFVALLAAVVLLAGYASLMGLRKLSRVDPGVDSGVASGADNRTGS